jgi:hypothetical protein
MWPMYYMNRLPKDQAATATRYSRMPTKELEKEIHNDVLTYATIKRTTSPIDYTYRAILFAEAGGHFKDESLEHCTSIWILGPNVLLRETIM